MPLKNPDHSWFVSADIAVWMSNSKKISFHIYHLSKMILLFEWRHQCWHYWWKITVHTWNNCQSDVTFIATSWKWMQWVNNWIRFHHCRYCKCIITQQTFLTKFPCATSQFIYVIANYCYSIVLLLIYWSRASSEQINARDAYNRLLCY